MATVACDWYELLWSAPIAGNCCSIRQSRRLKTAIGNLRLILSLEAEVDISIPVRRCRGQQSSGPWPEAMQQHGDKLGTQQKKTLAKGQVQNVMDGWVGGLFVLIHIRL